jgi:hypothetical protein
MPQWDLERLWLQCFLEILLLQLAQLYLWRLLRQLHQWNLEVPLLLWAQLLCCHFLWGHLHPERLWDQLIQWGPVHLLVQLHLLVL